MNVGEIVKKKGHEVITISIDGSFQQARELMNEKHIGALMVLDGSKEVAGIVTERDLLSKMEEQSVKKMMTPLAHLTTLKPGDPLQTAMNIFTEKKIRHLPVMEDGKLLGMLSIGDAIKNLLDAVELENKYLKEYIMGQDY